MTNLIPRVEFLAQALVRRRRSCPHCASRACPVVARKHWVVRVRRCERCRLCFTDPTYRSVMGPLYGGLYDAEGMTTRTPGSEELGALLESSFRGTDKDAHARLDVLAGLVPNGRMLEVGSSWGYFLHQAREHGFDPTGVELDAERRGFGRERLGADIVAGFEDLGDARFDVVYSAHTLEHFTDLAGVLPKVRSLLVPGGLLALEVPHFDLEGRGPEALSLVGAVHPLGFTEEFFRRNLPRAGFDEPRAFDRWKDAPERPVARCTSDVLIFLARRAVGSPAAAEDPDVRGELAA